MKSPLGEQCCGESHHLMESKNHRLMNNDATKLGHHLVDSKSHRLMNSDEAKAHSVVADNKKSTLVTTTTLCSRAQDPNQLTAKHTLRASLSGTFLQTLPDLVSPLKGHSLSPHSCPPTRSAPPKGLGTDQTPSPGLRHPSFSHCRV